MASMNPPRPVAWRQVATFVLWAYGISGVIAAGLYFSGLSTNRLAGIAFGVPFMFGPAIATWLTAKRSIPATQRGAFLGLPTDLPPMQRPRFFLNRWWFVAWLAPAFLALAITGVSLLLPHLTYDPEMTGLLERLRGMLPPAELEKAQRQLQSLPLHPFWLGIPQGLLAGLSINAIAAFGEELGWRGFLYRHLQPLGFWRSSLLTGAIWGLWHAPLTLQGHNYPQHPVLGIVWMVVFCVLLSPLLAWIREKSGSVLAAAILHGSINGLFMLPALVVKGGNELTSGATGIPGFLVLAAVTAVIARVRRRSKTATP